MRFTGLGFKAAAVISSVLALMIVQPAKAQLTTVKPAPDSRFENVLFKKPNPSVWKRVEKDGKLAFTTSAPKDEYCHVTILPGEKLIGGFPEAFDRRINAHLKLLESKIERDGGLQASKAAEGFDVLQRVIIGKTKKGHTYHWFVGGHSGDRIDVIVYEATTDVLWNRHKQDATEFLSSVKLYNSLSPAAVNALPAMLQLEKAAPRKPANDPKPETPAREPAATGADTSTKGQGVGGIEAIEESSGLGSILKGLGMQAPKNESAAAQPSNSASVPGTSTPGGQGTGTTSSVPPTPVRTTPPAGAPATVAPTSAAPINRPPDDKPLAIGPVHNGDTVEAMVDGKWQAGTVAYAAGLTYFVHVGDGKNDRFFHLYQLRASNSAQSFAQAYHDKTADPHGGPIEIGDTVEANVWNWIPCRVARRVGDMYIVFPEQEKFQNLKSEAWVGPSELRPTGSTKPFSDSPLAPPIKPLVAKDIRLGDHVESNMPNGFGWSEATVLAVDDTRYYVQTAADSAMRGWMTLASLRPVGSVTPFQAK